MGERIEDSGNGDIRILDPEALKRDGVDGMERWLWERSGRCWDRFEALEAFRASDISNVLATNYEAERKD